MNIIIITGSPHRRGTSSTLAEVFARGARQAGHTVDRFDAAFLQIHECTACNYCHKTQEGCVFPDGMELINEKLLKADYIVLSTPTYYYTFSASIKAVVDRFYAIDAQLHGHKKISLILTMQDTAKKAADSPVSWINNMAEYFGWEKAGNVIAYGCADHEALVRSPYIRQAYELGRRA